MRPRMAELDFKTVGLGLRERVTLPDLDTVNIFEHARIYKPTLHLAQTHGTKTIHTRTHEKGIYILHTPWDSEHT